MELHVICTHTTRPVTHTVSQVCSKSFLFFFVAFRPCFETHSALAGDAGVVRFPRVTSQLLVVLALITLVVFLSVVWPFEVLPCSVSSPVSLLGRSFIFLKYISFFLCVCKCLYMA